MRVSRFFFDAAIDKGDLVLTINPGVTRIRQAFEMADVPDFSVVWTQQTPQEPWIARQGWEQRRGMAIPFRSATWMMASLGSPVNSFPSIFTVM
jgi:hypothetical protein